MDIQDDKFDLQIRNLLNGGEEEVPADVWTAVSERLVAVNARIRRVRIIRRTAVFGGVAVAAAVLLGVFLWVRNPAGMDEPPYTAQTEADNSVSEPDSSDNPDTGTVHPYTAPELPKPVASSVAATAVLPEGEDEFLEITSIEEQIAQVEDYLANVETATACEEESAKEEEPGKEALDGITEDIEIEPASRQRQTVSYQNWEDSADFGEETTAQHKVRTAITMSGNALTNTVSSSASHTSGRQMVSSIIQNGGKEGITPTSEDSSYGIPVSFGIGAKVIFTQHWSLGVGVNYTLLTRTFAGRYTDASGSSADYSKIRNVQHYVGIPLNAYYSIVKSRIVDFYAYAGGAVEKCVANKYNFDNMTYSESVRGVQFSVNAGIGVEFIIADMVGFYIDPSLRYYIPNSNQPTSIRTQEPLNLGFELGFRVRF